MISLSFKDFIISIFLFFKYAFPWLGASKHPFLIFRASKISSTLGKP